MTAFPRYFAYGRRYFPPAPYVCVHSFRDQEIVYPLGDAIRLSGTLHRWIDRVQAGQMCETTKEDIADAIMEWNESNGPPLEVPD